MLHNVDWYLFTDVLEQRVIPIFKGQSIPFTLEDGNDRRRQLTANRRCVNPRRVKTLFRLIWSRTDLLRLQKERDKVQCC